MANNERQPLLHRTDEAVPFQQNEFDHPQALEGNLAPQSIEPNRKIGWYSAYILVMSRVIGSGVFAMPGTIVQTVGSPEMAVLLWIIGALIAWLGLAIDLEYGCMFPRSGGIKVYLENTYPRPRFFAATLVAVHFVLLGFTASNCIIFAKYLLFAVTDVSTDLQIKFVAIALLTAVVTLHALFFRVGLFIQNLLGWLKVGLIIFMICTGFSVLMLRKEHVQKATNNPFRYDNFWNTTTWNYNLLTTAIFKIFYSYAGLDNINNVLSEVKNPVRTLRTIGPIALLTTCSIYVLVNLAYLNVVPLKEIKESRELVAALFFQRVFGDNAGKVLLPVAVALSAAGNVMVVTFSLARLKQEIIRKGLLPFTSVLDVLGPSGSPLGGLAIHYVPSVLVIALSPSEKVYGFIANVEGYAAQIFGLAVAYGLLKLRGTMPDINRPFKAWKPAIRIRMALSLVLIAIPSVPRRNSKGGYEVSDYSYALVGVVSIICGCLYWLLWTKVIPVYRGYKLEEEEHVQDNGAVSTKLVYVKEEQYQ